MSGIIGHTLYAILGGRAAAQRKLPIAPLIHRHFSSYLCGAYLGCDIQTMPEAICVQTGEEVGYGTAPLEKSPITGGEVKPWTLTFEERDYRPREIHRLFYGRSHLVFGWIPAERKLAIPWDHLPDYVAMTIQDALELFEPGERKLAYLFGWVAHIVSDSLIKSVQPGITLDLLDGKYTPANRPIQDLVSFHQIGREEFGLNWKNLLSDLADTPVEEIQLHYMRTGRPRGLLGTHFPDGWAIDQTELLRRVLWENRRYQKIRNPRLIKQYELKKTNSGWECDPELSLRTGGLSYAEMVELADEADFRHALWQMGEAIGSMFDQIVQRVPDLQNLFDHTQPSWKEITRRWSS
ncbi:MAG: hypothetical protein HUJ26_01615 [Planctomycetaceae bacterium]|nr:hypothetical protein [Planctomycetaceae bacterium]